MSMSSRFTRKAQNALNGAMKYAGEMGHTYIGSEHILLGLLSDTKMVSVIAVVCQGHGGIFFYEIKRVNLISNIKLKLQTETSDSLNISCLSLRCQ